MAYCGVAFYIQNLSLGFWLEDWPLVKPICGFVDK